MDLAIKNYASVKTKSKLRWCTPLQATGYVHTSALDIVFY